MNRLLILVLLCSLPVSVCGAAELGSIRADTSSSSTEEREQRFYDSLRARSIRRAVPRLIYNMMFESGHMDTLRSAEIEDISHLYRPFEGCRIGNIEIRTHNIYENGERWIRRTANDLHTVTREGVIRRDLLFSEGQRVDPRVIVANIQLLRSRSYIYDVRITMVPRDGDRSVVDVLVNTYDRWTISIDAGLSGRGPGTVEFYDANFLGSGDRFSVQTNFDWRERSYGGNMLGYRTPNLLGTFVEGELVAGKRFYASEITLSAGKAFILPTDYEVGVSYSDKHEPYHMLYADSSDYYEGRFFHMWGGLSKYFDAIGSSAYLTAHFDRTAFDVRPGTVSEEFNPVFHDHRQMLFSTGLYREKFYAANMLYGFGVTEYVPSGYDLAFTGGYRWGEFGDHWYGGVSFRAGGFPVRRHYLMGGLSAGSYFDGYGGWDRAALNVEINYFSPLFESGMSRIRQFITVSYTQGWNRLGGSDEVIAFTDQSGPRGFTYYVTGVNRAALNSETVLFTPMQPYGFRMAFFAYGDIGLIGGRRNMFGNDFFTTIGVGVRIKNERMVFNTIQLRLGVCLGKAGLVDYRYVNATNNNRLVEYRYLPTYPRIVEFR